MQLLLWQFSPLWDAQDRLDVPKSTRLSRRLTQLPRSAVARWQTLTGLDLLKAALSLVAEDGLFAKERFDAAAFAAFGKKYSVGFTSETHLSSSLPRTNGVLRVVPATA